MAAPGSISIETSAVLIRMHDDFAPKESNHTGSKVICIAAFPSNNYVRKIKINWTAPENGKPSAYFLWLYFMVFSYLASAS
jgi:hypothetical protein